MWFDFSVQTNIRYPVSFIDEHTLIGKYIHLYRFSKYKNLFNKDVYVTIDPKLTIYDINHIYFDYDLGLEQKDNYILVKNGVDDILLDLIFDFYGYQYENDKWISKYDIVDPNEWIRNHSDVGKRETMYFNDKDISYYNLYRYLTLSPYMTFNQNIFYDYCRCIDDKNTKYSQLFNKDLTIDPISTIEQMNMLYFKARYEYDEEKDIILIKGKQLNKWNTILTTLFKFYGWYPRDERSVYPKFKIFDLKTLK